MVRETRKMWQYPWRYKESVTVVLGLLVVGFLLQIATGAFDFNLLRYPVNLLFCLFIILFLCFFSYWRQSAFYKWFSGIPFSVTLMTALLILGIVMGLTPQRTSLSHGNASFVSIAGIDRMTSSVMFVFIYFLILLSLGALIVRRIIVFRLKDYAFYLNHIGLWIILMASGLGAADMERYIMHVYEGEVEWRGTDAENEIHELPIAIELNDFFMEVYPPHLAVIDRFTGMVQPENKPDFFAIDTTKPEGKMAEWDIYLDEYIHKAIRNSDSTYHEVYMPGSSPAAKITARNRNTGAERSGWVYSGNISQLYMTLDLDTNYCIAMMSPEPERFVSDIRVYRKDKDVEQALLEVNKPYRAGAWTIYQYGYDEMAGNQSNYSVMELVYDPWLLPVYVGIIMLAAGSVCLLWRGNKRGEEEENDLG